MLQAVASFTAATGWDWPDFPFKYKKNVLINLRAAGKSPVCNPQNPRLWIYWKFCITFGHFPQSNSAAFPKELWSFRITWLWVGRQISKLSSLLSFTFGHCWYKVNSKGGCEGSVGEQLKFDWLTLSRHCLQGHFECLAPSSVQSSPTFPLLLLPSWRSHLSGHDWLLWNTLVSCVTACGRGLPGHDQTRPWMHMHTTPHP